jgi:hypothetical protein
LLALGRFCGLARRGLLGKKKESPKNHLKHELLL